MIDDPDYRKVQWTDGLGNTGTFVAAHIPQDFCPYCKGAHSDWRECPENPPEARACNANGQSDHTLRIEALRAATQITASVIAAGQKFSMDGKPCDADKFLFSMANGCQRWLEGGDG